MEHFEKDPDVPFDPPSEGAEPRKRWDLDDDAAGLAFDLPDDREATDGERRKIARDLKTWREEGDDEA